MNTLLCKDLNDDELLKRIEQLEKDNRVLLSRIQKCEEEKCNQEDFLISISHDLRTPLNTILSIVQLLNYIGYGNESELQLAKYIDMIQRNSYNMLKLVNNLIDITRLDKNHYEIHKTNVEIISLVKSIVDSIDEYISKKNLKIKFNSNTDSCIMCMDDEALNRILLNVISNAIKFTPANRNIYINIIKKESDLIISIKDEGIGISKSEQKNIFDRYIRAKKNTVNENEGSGIGLDLVYKLTKSLDGNVELVSDENKGTEVILTFPITILKNDTIKINPPLDNKVELLQVEFSDIYK